jgi:hypothetical protein
VLINGGGEGFDMAVQRGRAALTLHLPANAILSLFFKG